MLQRQSREALWGAGGGHLRPSCRRTSGVWRCTPQTPMMDTSNIIRQIVETAEGQQVCCCAFTCAEWAPSAARRCRTSTAKTLATASSLSSPLSPPPAARPPSALASPPLRPASRLPLAAPPVVLATAEEGTPPSARQSRRASSSGTRPPVKAASTSRSRNLAADRTLRLRDQPFLQAQSHTMLFTSTQWQRVQPSREGRIHRQESGAQRPEQTAFEILAHRVTQHFRRLSEIDHVFSSISPLLPDGLQLAPVGGGQGALQGLQHQCRRRRRASRLQRRSQRCHLRRKLCCRSRSSIPGVSQKRHAETTVTVRVSLSSQHVLLFTSSRISASMMLGAAHGQWQAGCESLSQQSGGCWS